MALQRFSVNNWLNENGYKSPSFDFTSTPDPYETAVKSSATKNKTLDLERFSVNDWLSDNGYEAPTFDNFLKNSTKYRYLSDEAQTVVKEDEQTNGWLGAIVGSLGAGVANLLSSAASTIERAFVPNTFSAEEMNRFNNDIPVLGTTQEIEQQTTEAQAKRREIMQPGYTWADKNIKPIENAVREWADVENEGWLTKAVSGAAESTPALLASYAMPLLGSALMFNQSFANTLENDVIIANAKAEQTGTQPNYQNLMTKAVAAGAIEVATEKMFNLFAGMKGSYKAMSEGATGIVPRVVAVLKGFYNGFAKETAEDVTQATLKQFALHILKKSAEEGIEEIASTFLNGLVASATTDKDKPLFATKKYPDGIISWEEVRGSFVGGAIMGGVMSGASGMNQRSKTKKYLASIENTPVQQVTETQADGLNEAMMQDAQNPSFQQEIKANVVASTVQMQEAIRDNALRVEPIEYETDVAPDATVAQPAITGEEPAINAKTETQTEPNAQTETFEDIINNRTETMSDVDRVQRLSEVESFDTKMERLATQEPSADIQGVVSPEFAKLVQDIPVTKNNSTKYTGVFDSDVRKSIDDSMTIKHDKTLQDRLADFKKFATRTFLRGSVNIPFQYGELRQRVQSYRNANSTADTKVENYILRIYNPVGKQNFKLMRDAVLLLDMKEDILDKKLYTQDMMNKLPFGIKSVNDALQMIVDVEQQLKTGKNQEVIKALNARRDTITTVRNELIKKAKTIGWDLTYLENRSEYMHHAILEYIDEQSKEKHRTNVKTSAYKGREGSYKNYVSDPALADYLVLRKMFKDMMKVDIYSELKTLDIKDALDLDEDGKFIVPDGYAEFDRRQMGLNYLEKNFEFEEESAIFMQMIKDGLAIPTENLKLYTKKAQEIHNDNVIVVPVEIRNAVVEEFELKNNSNQAVNLQRIATQAWKKWQLESPRRFFKYNIKNLAGDTDAMLMIYPQAVKKIKKSFNELTDLYKNGKLSAQLAKYAEYGGLSTSLSHVELGDLQSLPNFTFYESEESTGKLAVNKVRRIVGGIDKFTEWREQLLRYAAYLQQVEDLSKSPNGLPKDYGASIPAEIKSIKTIEGRAYKLSNDALGAYNDVTPMAQGMSKTIYPFFRFKEVNIKRFFRLARNLYYTDSESVANAGKSMADKFAKGAKLTGYAALKIGKIGLGYAAFNAALALWNNFVAPDEEEELPEDVRKTVHIVFPRWANPDGEIMYFNDLSSFYQLFNDIGFDGIGDVYNDLKEVVSGKMTIGDKVKEIATGATSSFLNGTAPFYKPVIEAIVGKSIYPDISQPSTVRDPWEHLFKAIGMDKEYRAVAGKPLPDGSYISTWKSAFVNSVVPGEAALWDVYDMKSRYYQSIGKTGFSGGTKDAKAMAIYNYKVALKLNDTQAAERYLKEYALHGGTQATFAKSMEALDPTYGMSKIDKKTFVDNLSESEKEKYNRAVEYYKSIQSLGNPSSLPKK